MSPKNSKSSKNSKLDSDAKNSFGYGSVSEDDPENQKHTRILLFTDECIKKCFIRKVYAILFIQTVITSGLVSIFVFSEESQRYVLENPQLFWISLVFMITTLLIITCCTEARRKAPMNYILLFLFTLSEAFMLGVATANFQREEILVALGITAVVCFALTLFSFQTKMDFTVYGAFLLISLVVLVLCGVVLLFFPYRTVTLVYAAFGSVIFSFCFIYDTQLMLSGNHKYSISPADYVFAALSLYLDIVNIFYYILLFFGYPKK